MGNSCAKGPPRDEGAGASGGDTPAAEKANFRDRRLSVSQVPNEKSPARRLSVYDDSAGGEPPAQVHESVATCSVKSVAGMEPVPGGSTRKINQARRALSEASGAHVASASPRWRPARPLNPRHPATPPPFSRRDPS